MRGDSIVPERSNLLTRRNFMLGSGSAAALALYAGEIARHEIDITQRTIRIAKLPLPFHGYRIVQFSDIHLDEYTEPGFIARVIRHINAIAPDLVLITGDYVSKGPLSNDVAIRAAGECGELLSKLTCPLRYGILGNHDVNVGSAPVTDHLQSTGTPLLINRYVPIERGGKRLWLGGVDDPSQSRPDIDLAVPERPDGPVILMAHEPDYADVIAAHPTRRNIDLVLSGHSHGGQVRLPFLPPLTLPPGAEKYYEGHYRVGNLQLYVNRGIGATGVPFRLFCPPEITVITLQAA